MPINDWLIKSFQGYIVYNICTIGAIKNSDKVMGVGVTEGFKNSKSLLDGPKIIGQ